MKQKNVSERFSMGIFYFTKKREDAGEKDAGVEKQFPPAVPLSEKKKV